MPEAAEAELPFSKRGLGNVGPMRRASQYWPEALLTTAVAAAYAVGSNRSFTDDEAYTVAHFVVGLPLFGPITEVTNINNHPLLSVLDQGVHRLFDSTDELTMRIVPIVAAALAVGVVFGVLRQRCGALGAVSGAAVLATNPMYLEHARLARGYGLAALGIAVSTLLVVRSEGRSDTSARDLLYVLACGLAIAAHLHSALAVVFHVLVVWDRKEISRRWILNWSAAIVIGAIGYVAMLEQLLVEADDGLWRPTFPLDLPRALLGGTTFTALILLALLAVGADSDLRRLIVLGAAAIGPPVAVLWLIVQPKDLYPRFLLWTLPLIALAIGRAVGRDWRLAVPVVAVALLGVFQAADRYTRDAHPMPAAAPIAQRDLAEGGGALRTALDRADVPGVRAGDPDHHRSERVVRLHDRIRPHAHHRPGTDRGCRLALPV